MPAGMFAKLKAAAFGKKEPNPKIQRSRTGTFASQDERLQDGEAA